VRVISQRGANGIDGLISLAIGASTGFPGRTLLVLGDVSALHDQSALSSLARHGGDLTVIVINNQGGRIFEELPIAELPATDAWITPHPFELWRLGPVFGVASALVDSSASLELALAEAQSNPGPRWIEARVAPDGAKRWGTALRARVSAALADWPG
jgi:2-succinyl-5-enolpyruvyl-6-hydroxy-3-cyclohexene-1-carboxylate synthase